MTLNAAPLQADPLLLTSLTPPQNSAAVAAYTKKGIQTESVHNA